MSIYSQIYIYIYFFVLITSLKDCGRPFTVDITVASLKRTKCSGFSKYAGPGLNQSCHFLFSNLRGLSIEILCSCNCSLVVDGSYQRKISHMKMGICRQHYPV